MTAGVTIVLLGFSFLYVVQSTHLRDLTARIAGAQEDLIGIQEVNRTLQFEIEQAFSLDRVSRMAREQLGMIEPTTVKYIAVPREDDD